MLPDFGVGSDILGRMVDVELEAVFVLVADDVEEEFEVEFKIVVLVVEVADCLVELAAPAPAPSLAEEVRLTECDCDWSSECEPFWDFWAMVSDPTSAHSHGGLLELSVSAVRSRGDARGLDVKARRLMSCEEKCQIGSR